MGPARTLRLLCSGLLKSNDVLILPYDCWTLEDGAVIIGVLDYVLIPETYLLLKYLEDRSCGIFRLVIYE